MPQGTTPAAVTSYIWTKAGKLDTMTDPGVGSTGRVYNYDYDTLNRLTKLTFPADGGGVVRADARTYDAAGNLKTFTNRSSQVQTFTYDSRNRETNDSWSNGNPLARTFTYDDASRVTSCNTGTTSSGTFINFTYYDDGLLHTQEEWGAGSYGDNIHRTLTYGYDADGNKTSLALSPFTTFGYTYTARQQLESVTAGIGGSSLVSYTYDKSGNPLTRNDSTGPSSSFVSDAMNRLTNVTHTINGVAHSFKYGYDEVGNRQYVQYDGGAADGYGYNSNSELTSYRLGGTLS
ncbi:MAG TPA: hypothetical protein VGK72_01955, partial [Chthoniobacterales bacterium]